MSNAVPNDCSCPTAIVSNVPGSPGVNGVNSFTSTTSPISLNMAMGTIVTISVVNSQWMANAQVIFVSDGTNVGHFLVVSAPTAPYTSVQCVYFPQTTDTVGGIGVQIASGAIVSPSAYNGADSYTYLQSGVTIPSAPPAPQAVTIAVNSTTGFAVGMIIAISDGTNAGHFYIAGVTAPHTLTANYIANYDDSPRGTTIVSTALVGPSARDGFSAYAVTTQSLAFASGAYAATLTVLYSQMFAVGEPVFLSDGSNWGNFTISSISGTTVGLTWLNLSGDTGTTIGSGAKMVPTGTQAPGTSALYSSAASYPSGSTITNTLGGPITIHFSAGEYTIPAGTLVNAGDSITFEAIFGFTGADATAEQITISFGGTTIYTSVTSSPPTANDSLIVRGTIVVTGATAQFSYCQAQSVFATIIGASGVVVATPGAAINAGINFTASVIFGGNTANNTVTMNSLIIRALKG